MFHVGKKYTFAFTNRQTSALNKLFRISGELKMSVPTMSLLRLTFSKNTARYSKNCKTVNFQHKDTMMTLILNSSFLP